jgi:hypothetical protein
LNIKHFPTGAGAHAVEQEILRQYRADRYHGPDLLRAGNDELFTQDILGLDTGDMHLSFVTKEIKMAQHLEIVPQMFELTAEQERGVSL